MRAGRAASAVAADALPLYLFADEVGEHAHYGNADHNDRNNFKRSHIYCLFAPVRGPVWERGFNAPRVLAYCLIFLLYFYALFFLRSEGSFILPLFLKMTIVANTAATASQMKSVHHQLSTV